VAHTNVNTVLKPFSKVHHCPFNHALQNHIVWSKVVNSAAYCFSCWTRSWQLSKNIL